MRFVDTSKNDGECSSMNGVTWKTFTNFGSRIKDFAISKAVVNDKMCPRFEKIINNFISSCAQ